VRLLSLSRFRGAPLLHAGNLAIPVGVDLDANLKFKSWGWTVAGTYGVIATPEHSMRVLAGARLLDLEEKLTRQFNGNVAALPLAAAGSAITSTGALSLPHGAIWITTSNPARGLKASISTARRSA